jgi:phosphomannomutase
MTAKERAVPGRPRGDRFRRKVRAAFTGFIDGLSGGFPPMLGRVFKAYDVRGTYPDPLNENLAWQIGYGCSKYLLADAQAAGDTSPMMHNIVVGRDMRTSSPSLNKSLVQGINDHGGHVIDVGMVDTSMIYFAVNHLDCAGGVMVTASHNPPQYNGFKVSKRKAKPVGETTGLAEIRKHAAMVDKVTLVPQNGRVEQRDLWPAYVKHVRSFLDLGNAKLKVVIDASNGMAGTMVPRVFGTALGKSSGIGAIPGLTIVELNFENSKGQFAHEPNPLVAANLRQLQAAVVAEKADLGVCFDGDADRCVIVDEMGNIVGCDHLTALLARYFLAKSPGASVIYDLRSTKAVEEEIKAAGGKPVRSRVGHVFMKAAMGEQKGVFGGELSGHFYFRDNFNADSGAIAMAVTLTVLAQSRKKMSQLIAPIMRYPQSGEINFTIEDKDGAIAELRRTFAAGAQIDDLDGITVDCFARDGWWCNVRKSNTEPLLRLNCEARDRRTLEQVLSRISPMLGKKVDH